MDLERIAIDLLQIAARMAPQLIEALRGGKTLDELLSEARHAVPPGIDTSADDDARIARILHAADAED